MRFSLILLVFTLSYAKIVEVVRVGKTYPFAEKDFLEEINTYLKNHKGEIVKKSLKLREKAKEKILAFKPDTATLTPAEVNSTRIIDLTYTLPFDIKDANGKIIYPKGFTFNPAKYVRLNYEIVVLNANRKEEVEWFFKSKYSKNPLMYRVFLTDGSWYEFAKRYKHQVYYCLPQIQKRFKLRHTISIIKQIGDKFQIKEIAVK